MLFYLSRKHAGFSVVAFLLSFLMARPLFASPAYGTTMPERNKIFMGVQHHYIQDRELENNVGNVHSDQNYLTLSYGLMDWLSLDLKWSLFSRFRVNSPDGSATKYEDSVWGGGYGLRVKVYESGPVKGVVGFQHFSIHPKPMKSDAGLNGGILEDWQGSALVSYSFKSFTPYAGLRYTMLDYLRYIDHKRKMIKSDDDRMLGLIVGTDVPLGKRVFLNVEADCQEQGAFTAGITYRF